MHRNGKEPRSKGASALSVTVGTVWDPATCYLLTACVASLLFKQTNYNNYLCCTSWLQRLQKNVSLLSNSQVINNKNMLNFPPGLLVTSYRDVFDVWKSSNTSEPFLNRLFSSHSKTDCHHVYNDHPMKKKQFFFCGD